MWGIQEIGQKAIKALLPKNDNLDTISAMDVKVLYDVAYAEQANAPVNIRRFRSLMRQAVKLDAAYRAQLAQSAPAATFRYGGTAR